MALTEAICEPIGDESAPRARTILLTGTYSSQNKGDAAMELSAAAALSERFGEATEVVISAPFADADRSFYAPTPVVPCDRRQLIKSTYGLLKTVTGRNFGFQPSRSTTPMAEADLVIDLSGDMLTEDYGPHVAYSHFLPLLRAKALGIPYFICAQSVGPFKATKPLALHILNNAHAVTVRDNISYNYLRDIGVREEVLKQTADLAFLLPSTPRDEAKAFDPGAQIGGSIIGVSVSKLVAKRFDKANSQGDFVRLMAKALDHTAKETGARILFTPHVTGPTPEKDDRLISREVAATLSSDVTSHVIEDNLRPEQIKGVIANCDIFIGCRMHANIAALSSHVPTVALAYSHKTPGIMRACGVEEFVLNGSDLTIDTVTQQLSAVWNARTPLRERLTRTVAEQRLAARQNIDIAAKLLDNKTS